MMETWDQNETFNMCPRNTRLSSLGNFIKVAPHATPLFPTDLFLFEIKVTVFLGKNVIPVSDLLSVKKYHLKPLQIHALFMSFFPNLVNKQAKWVRVLYSKPITTCYAWERQIRNVINLLWTLTEYIEIVEINYCDSIMWTADFKMFSHSLLPSYGASCIQTASLGPQMKSVNNKSFLAKAVRFYQNSLCKDYDNPLTGNHP